MEREGGPHSERVMQLRHFESRSELEQAVEAAFRDAWSAPAEPPVALMLTGGQTPLGVYQRLTQSPLPDPPEPRWIVLSDERYVPPGSPQHNLRHLEPLLAACRIPPERVLAVDTRLPEEQAERRFCSQLDDFFDQGGLLRLAVLGLGADGHVAGLFSPADVQHPAAALRVRRADGLQGISVGSRVLRRAEQVIFMVRGEDKQPAIRRLLETPEPFPAGRVFAGHSHTAIWYCPRG